MTHQLFRLGIFQWVVFCKSQEYFFWVTCTNHLVPVTCAVPPAVAWHLFFLQQSDSKTVTLTLWCYGYSYSIWNATSVNAVQNVLSIPYAMGTLEPRFLKCFCQFPCSRLITVLISFLCVCVGVLVPLVGIEPSSFLDLPWFLFHLQKHAYTLFIHYISGP